MKGKPPIYAITATGYRSIAVASDLAEGETAACMLPAALLSSLAGTEVRTQRDALLRGCDWTQVADAPLTDAERAAWQSFRQALRSIPDQSGFPAAIQWPDVPVSTAK